MVFMKNYLQHLHAQKKFKNYFFLVNLFVFCFGWSQWLEAQPRAGGRGLSLRDIPIQFSFDSQDGDIHYDCKQQWLENLEDFEVTCVLPKESSAVTSKRFTKKSSSLRSDWKFVVHARVFIHKKDQAPKRSYEILYWVTDRQLTGGAIGEFVGSTLWFHLQEDTPLMQLEAGQDIQNTWTLTMKINLGS